MGPGHQPFDLFDPARRRFLTGFRSDRSSDRPGIAGGRRFVSDAVVLGHSLEECPQEKQPFWCWIGVFAEDGQYRRHVEVVEFERVGDAAVQRGLAIVEQSPHLGMDRSQNGPATPHPVGLCRESVGGRLEQRTKPFKLLADEILELIQHHDVPVFGKGFQQFGEFGQIPRSWIPLGWDAERFQSVVHRGEDTCLS